jgi:hypothetical protein
MGRERERKRKILVTKGYAEGFKLVEKDFRHILDSRIPFKNFCTRRWWKAQLCDIIVLKWERRQFWWNRICTKTYPRASNKAPEFTPRLLLKRWKGMKKDG